ncbi:MAG: flagellar hook-basal body protein [Planctomycetota bacterium]|jgi:flagellar basal-body rod protein FlgG
MLGFHISLSGIRVGLRRLETSADNIANISTPGFKAARADVVDLGGRGAAVGSVRVDFSPGPIDVEGGGFSIAIDGEGLFRVATADGERFTRAGAFRTDAEGTIVTPEGHPLLPRIQIPEEATSVVVGRDGTVSAVTENGGRVDLGRITLVRFDNPEGLSREGGNLLAATPASGGPIEGPPGEGPRGSLVFGALEGSNVDLATEMISQIVASSTVRANIAALKSRDEALGVVVDLRG